MFYKVLFQIIKWQRTTVIIALVNLTVFILEKIQLLFFFYTLGNRIQSKLICNIDDGLYQQSVVRIFHYIEYKRFIYLKFIEW